MNLIQVIDNSKDATAITSLTIVIVVLFIGAYGSFKNERNYLITFALILIIATIVGFVGKAAIYTSLGFNIVLIILALTQSEMLRRGF